MVEAIVNSDWWKESIPMPSKPSWAKKDLGEDEYEVGVIYAVKDEDYAVKLANALAQIGLSVIYDQANVQKARCMVLVYSDDTQYDESAVRNATRAAERFNLSDTIIVPVLTPDCTEYVLDKIPDNLAYSLSNTSFIDFKYALDIHRTWRTFTEIIKDYVHDTDDFDVDGLWVLQVVTQGDCDTDTPFSRDFTIFLEQDEEKNLIGYTPNGVTLEGKLVGDEVNLTFNYQGHWNQLNELWELADYHISGAIRAKVSLQGHRLEGKYVEVTPHGTKRGILTGTHEDQGISGYYSLSLPGQEDSYMGVVHKGGGQIQIDIGDLFGILNPGLYNDESGSFNVMATYGNNSGFFMNGTLYIEEGQIEIRGHLFVVKNGENATGPVEFTLKYLGNINKHEAGENDEGVALDGLNSSDKDTTQPSFDPFTFEPLGEGEFAAIIACTEADKPIALKLKANLEKRKIAPISISLEDSDKARTAILLLSSHTRESSDLIYKVDEWATNGVPIYNIGLGSWFEIFGDAAWDPELKKVLCNALARLNQTDASTLEPSNPNFRALVRRIKEHIFRPLQVISGMWVLRHINPKDEGTHVIPRLFAIKSTSTKKAYLFSFTGEGTDYVEATFENSTFQFANDSYNFEMNVNRGADKMKGLFTFHDGSTYDVMYTHDNSGISGCYTLEDDYMGFAQIGTSGLFSCYKGVFYDGVVRGNKFALINGEGESLMGSFGDVSSARSHRVIRMNDIASPQGSQIVLWKGKGYLGAEPRVPDRGLKNQKCPDQKVVENITGFFKTFKSRNSEAAGKFFLAEPGAEVFSPEDFEDEVEKYEIYGKFVSVTNYIGRYKMDRESPQAEGGEEEGAEEGGEEEGAEEGAEEEEAEEEVEKKVEEEVEVEYRYEFDVKFEHNDSLRIVTHATQSGKLLDIQTVEEEASENGGNIYDSMISYRSKDCGFINLLQEHLEARGILCWRDRRMEVGSNWSADITNAVRTSQAVISCISEPYITSPLCTKEVRMAYDVGKPILLIILPETEEKKDKLVSSHYKLPYVPITIAREGASITWIDLRPEGGKNTPDPQNLKEFSKKYAQSLENLETQLRNTKATNTLFNLSGKWEVKLNGYYPTKSEEDAYIVLVHKSGSVKGVIYFPQNEESVPFLESNSINGSCVELIASRGDLTSLISIRIILDASGDKFSGWYFLPDGERGSLKGSRSESVKEVDLDRVACYEDWVEDQLDMFWALWLCGDWNGWSALWKPEVLEQSGYTLESFKEEKIQKEQDIGEYIDSTFIDVYTDEDTQFLRYDFACNFQKKKGLKHYFIFDNDGYLVGAQDYED